MSPTQFQRLASVPGAEPESTPPRHHPAQPGFNANALRNYPGYANLMQCDTGANFNYHSLQTSLRKQWSKSGSASVSYTWAKNIGDNSGWNESSMDSTDARRDRYENGGTATRWFNPVAFANPTAGAWGNLNRNSINGPGTHNWDVSAQKAFAIAERMRLEFRAEIYTAPQHFSYFGAGSTVGAGNFGQVTSANDPRTSSSA